MDAKVVKSVCIKDEIKTLAEVEVNGNIVKLTINGVNSSVSLNMDKNQARSFFKSALDISGTML